MFDRGIIMSNQNVSRELPVVAVPSVDIIMSMAASVMATLLLLSGDVEENPGPGGSLIIIACLPLTG